MGINSTEVAYHFGQMGSAYLDDTGAFTPPTGKVIVAITTLEAVKFANLIADASYIDLLQLVLITVIGAYFGGRSLEKVKK